MPEGDTIFRSARALNRALAGKVVTRFEAAYAHLASVDDDKKLAGRTIERVEARGQMAADVFLRRFDPGDAHADERLVASISNRGAMAASAAGYACCDRDCRLERGGILCSSRGVSFGGVVAAKDNDF